MDLQAIKFYCEKQGKGIKQLATEVDMSEPNLHRCIRLNKIQASDLEKIANALDVGIEVFFDEVKKKKSSVKSDSEAVRNDFTEELIRLRAENDVLREVVGLRKKNEGGIKAVG